MTPDKLELRAIIPMKQTFEMGCGPTSIAMAFSGLGVHTSEKALIDNYFPTAALPLIEPTTQQINYGSGLSNPQLLEGIVRIVEDMGLQDKVNVDVFDANLTRYVASYNGRYIVEVHPRTISGFRAASKHTSEFYSSLETLAKKKKIGVYTASARLLPFLEDWRSKVEDEVKEGFYHELAEFVGKGHIVGLNNDHLPHIRALDGSKRVKGEGYVILDPRGEETIVALDDLVRVDHFGILMDEFKYLFRVSPKDIVRIQRHSISDFLSSILRAD